MDNLVADLRRYAFDLIEEINGGEEYRNEDGRLSEMARTLEAAAAEIERLRSCARSVLRYATSRKMVALTKIVQDVSGDGAS